MEKVTDFNNTWCEATEENYNKLLELNYTHSDYGFEMNSLAEYIFINGKYLFVSQIKTFFDRKKLDNLKQIHLVDGEFYYVEREMSELDKMKEGKMEDNSFEVKEKSFYVHKDGGTYQVTDKALSLHKEAIVFYKHIDSDREFCRTISHFRESFKPLKKNWWEKEENIGKLVYHRDFGVVLFDSFKNNVIVVSLFNGKVEVVMNFDLLRPATHEECLSLCIDKED